MSCCSTVGRSPVRERVVQDQRGQAALLLVAAMCVVLVAAVVLGGIAAGLGGRGDNQRAADLGALGGARAMRSAYARGCSSRRT